MDNKKIVAVQLDKELFELLKKMSKEEDRSISSIIRTAIKKYLENNEKR